MGFFGSKNISLAQTAQSLTSSTTFDTETENLNPPETFAKPQHRKFSKIKQVDKQAKTMSRICVKNLPKNVAEARLRDHFSQKGEVTDARLMRTSDGKSRQFAFIGFRTEHEAEEARSYFNNSYLDTFRITCEIARQVGDPTIPRPWSRHSKKEDKPIELEKDITRNVGSKEEGKDDQKLKEFLDVMVPRNQTKLWGNDTLGATTADQNVKVSKKQKMKENAKKSAPGKDDSELDDDSGSEKESDSHTEKSGNLAKTEAVSAMDYLKSKTKKNWSDSESSDDDDDDDKKSSYTEKLDPKRENDIVKPDVPREEAKGKPSSTVEEEPIDTNRLFVRNLPYTANEEELKELFSKYGEDPHVHIVKDKDTKQSIGLAYIHYALPESASRALKEMERSIFQGRFLHVMPAKQKITSKDQEHNNSASKPAKTFKQKREDERKEAEAKGDTRAWNTLYMRSDTIVENIARKLGVSKSDFLDRDAGDLAVRIALGETQVIAETKKSLTNAGINVEALEEFASGKSDGLKRSNHVILVKNLPYGSYESELAEMFGKFGSLDKVILPPTKTMGLVVFLEPSDARKAVRGLAYKRYKDAPLYLEWAPENILSENVASKIDVDSAPAVGEQNVERAIVEQRLEGTLDDVDADRVESRSLYVKNLNFKTSDDSLRKHFNGHLKKGKILSVKVKKHLKNGKNLSAGFGFIEFDSVETATSVCRDLQGTILDEHDLRLQLCHAKTDEKVSRKTEDDKSSTKLIVRNVAFEATEKELRQLFSPFGQVKSLRLPKKFGNHRGFAFVEFVTKQEAQNALQALSSTHLYGRHLILEKAKEGETLEELRARTDAHYSEEPNGFQNTSKVSKKRKFSEEEETF